jgi:hypothetical protein
VGTLLLGSPRRRLGVSTYAYTADAEIAVLGEVVDYLIWIGIAADWQLHRERSECGSLSTGGRVGTRCRSMARPGSCVATATRRL